MDRKKMKLVSNKLMFNVDEKVMDKVEKVFNSLELKIKKMQMIDTNGVEPMIFTDKKINPSLRDDEHSKALPQENVLKNAPLIQRDYIVLKKVVK